MCLFLFYYKLSDQNCVLEKIIILIIILYLTILNIDVDRKGEYYSANLFLYYLVI